MAEATLNQRWAATIAGTLVATGVRDVVVAPGSRSTPLALAFADRRELQCWPCLDERSAAFLALGLSKARQHPAAVLCTSGTAGAHFLPALMEAREGGTPLIAITADRPAELHGFGAPQTIEQGGLFGGYVRRALTLPEPFDSGLAHVAASVAALVATALHPARGGVHLNVPFREPLAHPDGLAGPVIDPAIPFFGHSKAAPDLGVVRSAISQSTRGVIVVGPRERSDGLAPALHRLGAALGFPVFAEAASNARFGAPGAIWAFDGFLRAPSCVAALRPEVILRFGGGLTLKSLQTWVDGSAARVFAFLDDTQPFDPNHRCEAFFGGEVVAMVEALMPRSPRHGSELVDLVSRAQAACERVLTSRTGLEEALIARAVVRALRPGTNLVLSSSMPIRDVDATASAGAVAIRVFANRGVNGIDGVVSTSVGVALGTDRPTVLLIGDVAALHDLSGWLTARSTRTNLTVVVVNNDGGGIFSFLPVAERTPHFERFFGTPHGVDFEHVAGLAGASLARPDTLGALDVSVSRAVETGGVHLIEVRTDRRENVEAHRSLHAALVAAVEAS